MRIVLIVLIAASTVGAVTSSSGQEKSAVAGQHPSGEQLQQWLRQYPKADTNGDGTLTVQEADAFRQKLQRREKSKRLAKPSQFGFRTEFTFATMSDGVKIALAIGYPRDFDPTDTSHKWPAMLNVMGYPGSTVPDAPGGYGDRYVTVRASLRGAGASGGVIRAISRRNGMDGYEIIENWIVNQPWSNGKVALHGHSWGGLSGLMIAATNPPHLKAVAISGLLDDTYRDIGRIGGIRNAGFPVDWTASLYEPTGPFGSGAAAMQARGLSQDTYLQIVASRPKIDYTESLLWKLLASDQEPAEAKAASPGTFAAGIRAPIHIMHAYQDEQTGPSGLWLWTYIPDDVPKRLVLTNGNHGTVNRFSRERLEWLNFWTLGEGHVGADDFADIDHRVQIYFETPISGAINKPLLASDFPLPQTEWTRYYFHANHELSTSVPEQKDAERPSSDTYKVAPTATFDPRHGLYYLKDFEQPTALCGPICVTLWASCSTIDTDFYVAIADVDAEERIQFLQRGLLRGSHRALDKKQSMWITHDKQQALVRPRHTHRDPEPIEPNKPTRFDIEIYPVGHVFRAGHRLAIWIGQPPVTDPVGRDREGRGRYIYESLPPGSQVKVLRSADYPSSVLLPILPKLPPVSSVPPQLGRQVGVFAE